MSGVIGALSHSGDRGDAAKDTVWIIFRGSTPEQIAAQTKQYEDRFLSPFVAAERGTIDGVIIRRRIARAVAVLKNKTAEMPRRKHDNLPV